MAESRTEVDVSMLLTPKNLVELQQNIPGTIHSVVPVGAKDHCGSISDAAYNPQIWHKRKEVESLG